LEKHLLQQVRRSKFQIEMTDFTGRRTLKQCGGLFFVRYARRAAAVLARADIRREYGFPAGKWTQSFPDDTIISVRVVSA